MTSFTITQEAQSQIIKALQKERLKEEKDLYFRVSVEAGGCSGFQYVFSFDSQLQSDDKVFGAKEGQVVIDASSYAFLEGAELVYEEDLMGATFVIKKNPKAQLSCGCGASFSPF